MRKNEKIWDNRKEKRSFLQKHYSLSWRYIIESRKYVLFVILIFLIGAVTALFFQPPEFVELIKSFVERVLQETYGLNLWQLIVYILNNNLKNSFVAMLLGTFFGIFPFSTALINGYVLGFVIEKSVQVEGIFVLWRLFPHGIFELPAVILALALGIKFGMFIFSENKTKEFLTRLENSLRVFLFVILPLLIIASIIEGALIFVLG